MKNRLGGGHNKARLWFFLIFFLYIFPLDFCFHSDVMSPRRPRRQSGRERGEKKQDGQTATDKRERSNQVGESNNWPPSRQALSPKYLHRL